MSILETMLTGKITSDIVMTPENVAQDMVDLLPNEVWTSESTFLDMATKEGIFLKLIYDKLMKSTDLINKFPDETKRRNHILQNQIYGLAVNEFCAALSQRRIYGRMENNSNIKCINGYYDIIRDDRRFKLTIERTFKNMKFDVVIGNPPYNSDLYLDFLNKGYTLLKEDGVMVQITPAKWQAKGGKKNDDFRKQIVPYMSEIIHYKDSTDVFDIQEWGGISIIKIDKNIHNTKLIVNKCSKNKVFESAPEEHIGNDILLLPNKIIDIVNKCMNNNKSIATTLGFKQSLYVKNTNSGYAKERETDIMVMQGDKHTGWVSKSDLFTQAKLDKYKCICSIMPGAVASFDKNGQVLGMFKIVYIGPNQVPKGSFPVLKYFDSEDECKSFISYCNTKLVAFLYYIGTCGTTLTSEFWRFVPDPVNFDHIFTDDELYKKYNLTQDEIDIIESVIKERK